MNMRLIEDCEPSNILKALIKSKKQIIVQVTTSILN